jgi:hypothetical protein
VKKRATAQTPMKSRNVSDEQSPNTSGNENWQRIATKAYELYEQRGGLDGHALEDWLKAESIVNGTVE